jgi:hypothetical protein
VRPFSSDKVFEGLAPGGYMFLPPHFEPVGGDDVKKLFFIESAPLFSCAKGLEPDIDLRYLRTQRFSCLPTICRCETFLKQSASDNDGSSHDWDTKLALSVETKSFISIEYSFL